MPRFDTTLLKKFFTRKIDIPKKPIAIARSNRPYIVDQGWQRVSGATYPEWHGYYRIRFGSFKGRVEMSYQPKYYVRNPPAGITRHSHSACFTDLRNGGWWSVHWKIQPQDIDSGVMELERILREAYLLTKQPA
jgi:hypothetical protein